MYALRKDVNAKEVTLSDFEEAKKRIGPSTTPDMEKWYKSFMQQARQVQKPATPVT
jgi:transitional endoplasmic reticulum ATPase